MGGIRIVLRSEEETLAFARHAARLLPQNAILALSGDLGAGKTTFVQGLAAALLITEPVQSPTFTYLNIYQGTCPLYHFDLYRMKTPFDFFALGFEEYLDAPGISAIEWPERLEGFLPMCALSFHFSHEKEGRAVHISSPIDENLVNSLAQWD